MSRQHLGSKREKEANEMGTLLRKALMDADTQDLGYF